jgi:phosphoribosylformylglycinamidine synthase II
MRMDAFHYTTGTKARMAGFFITCHPGRSFGDGVQTLANQEQQTGITAWIEIHNRCGVRPAAADELASRGIEIAQVNRLLCIEAPEDHQHLVLANLDALLDPMLECVIPSGGDDIFLDVTFHPGVTDGEGECASLALELACSHLAGVLCHSGLRYHFHTPLPHDLRAYVERRLGNPLIHALRWSDSSPQPYVPAPPPQPARRIGLVHLVPGDLERLSRELGLSLKREEMRAIGGYFDSAGREPTDVELQSLAQTWSEHCSHKTFKATIDFRHGGSEEMIAGLLDTCIVAPSKALARAWVRSAFVDNAGVVALNDAYDIAFKVETHNHPSALEPFGGAHTGVGGVIRDVLAVSAEPFANTDVLCFGPPNLDPADVPPGVIHPATTYRDVVRGIADYGNNMGIPTVGGAVLFHPGYTSNPLVFCGTLGVVPRDSHPTSPRPGDLVMVLGGRTGRDGLHGATMSSAPLDHQHVEGTVVQIGNPITEKTVRDVLPALRDRRLYHAITDCGAGGLCSAVGEMGHEIGVEVELSAVPLKYPGLGPWEIWLSEAQERMVLAVPEESLPAVRTLCRVAGVEASVIGRFRDDGRLSVRHGSEIVADLDMQFLHRGRPPLRLAAEWSSSLPDPYPHDPDLDANQALLALLSHPTVASKEEVVRQYDHEVGAATVLKPLAGDAGPSDAAVMKPLVDSWEGIVISHGINPCHSSDPYAMAMLAVDEALRNLVAVGGSIDRAALLDNFCWGDVADPRQLGGLVRAAQGCGDAVSAYGTPFICGKDSLYNSAAADGTSIPGTLLISAAGVIPDIRCTVTMDLKREGNSLYLCGLTADEMGGSLHGILRDLSGGTIPRVRPQETGKVMQALSDSIRRGLVQSCHDLSEGGLAVAVAEMVIAGGLGANVDLELVPPANEVELPTEALLFSESPGRFLLEVDPSCQCDFVQRMASMPCAPVGTVTGDGRLQIKRGAGTVIDLPRAHLSYAWRGR